MKMAGFDSSFKNILNDFLIRSIGNLISARSIPLLRLLFIHYPTKAKT